MRFSEALIASSLAIPFVTAHGGARGVPKIWGMSEDVKRDIFAGAVPQRPAFGPSLKARDLRTRQNNGNTDGRCGASNGGAKCAAGYCCSSEGWCGNTPDYCNAPDCQLDYGPGCDANKVPNGESTQNVARPKLGSVAYGNDGLYSCSVPGTVALTFDDGPYIYTDYVLDLFAKYNAKATFFITGNNNGKGAIDDASKAWPAIISKMYAAGHQVASHTWSHQDLSKITAQQRKDQMIRNEMAIRNIIQKFPTYMRPPYSSCDKPSGCFQDMADLGYHVIYFDIDTDDYNNDSPSKIQNAKNNFNKYFQTDNVKTDDFLTIAHDIHEQTAHNLTEYMLQTLQKKGYRGVTVGECLGDPVENWYRASSGKIVTSSSAVASATSTAASSATSTKPTATPTAVSTDGTCGGTNNFKCTGSQFGNCCSSAGWCGSSSAYCGTGCNPLFGTCGVSSSSASAPAPSGSTVPSKDGTCGGTSGYNCNGWANGECCSQYGWCGSTTDHCGTGCNPLYGKCTSSSSPSAAPVSSSSTIATSARPSTTTSAAPSKTSAPSNISTNGKCGAKNGSKSCPNSQCCSSSGTCGTSFSACWVGCQKQYGTCW